MLKLVQIDNGVFDLAYNDPVLLDDMAALEAHVYTVLFSDAEAPLARVPDRFERRGWWANPQEGSGLWHLRRQPLSVAARGETLAMIKAAVLRFGSGLTAVEVTEVPSTAACNACMFVQVSGYLNGNPFVVRPIISEASASPKIAGLRFDYALASDSNYSARIASYKALTTAPPLDLDYWYVQFARPQMGAAIRNGAGLDFYIAWADCDQPVSLNWDAQDAWGHDLLSYSPRSDMSGVKWRFKLSLDASCASFESNAGPVLTLHMLDGSQQIIRLWNYVVAPKPLQKSSWGDIRILLGVAGSVAAPLTVQLVDPASGAVQFTTITRTDHAFLSVADIVPIYGFIPTYLKVLVRDAQGILVNSIEGYTVDDSSWVQKVVVWAGQSNAFGHFNELSGGVNAPHHLVSANTLRTTLANSLGLHPAQVMPINASLGSSAADKMSDDYYLYGAGNPSASAANQALFPAPTNYWYDVSTGTYGPRLNDFVALVGPYADKVCAIIWSQGENDIGGYPIGNSSVALYSAATTAIFDAFRALVPAAQAPIVWQITTKSFWGGYAGDPNPAETVPATWMLYRNAQREMISARVDVVLGSWVTGGDTVAGYVVEAGGQGWIHYAATVYHQAAIDMAVTIATQLDRLAAPPTWVGAYVPTVVSNDARAKWAWSQSLLSLLPSNYSPADYVTNRSATFEIDFVAVVPGWFIDPAQGVVAAPIRCTSIKSLGLNFSHQDRGLGIQLPAYIDGVVTLETISCTGSIDYVSTVLPSNGIQMTIGYDDVYHLNPKRVAENIIKLGYQNFCTCYIGMSHFFNLGWDTAEARYRFMPSASPMNTPAKRWLRDFYSRLKAHNMALVFSMSYEMLDMHVPYAWRQLAFDGTPGLSGWNPPSAFLAFTRADVMDYLKFTAADCLGLCDATDMKYFQVGEPWWWDGSYSNHKPCFYDATTQAKYLAETGSPMYNFVSLLDPVTDPAAVATAAWLNTQLGNSTTDVIAYLKSLYSNVQGGVLFFTSQAFGTALTLAVNYPKKSWSYPVLDFIQLEAYDDVTAGNLVQHDQRQAKVMLDLKFPLQRVQYFGGFVLNNADAAQQWPLIFAAMQHMQNVGVINTAVWSYSQIMRDGVVAFTVA